ncbi:hypothetical protein FACS1894156_3250 [Bacteroidia bacterium]|nr:hypothetical protein FACS1894156_3250 [Bacteroidia bacterium]
MEIRLMPTAIEDIEFWKSTGNVKIQKRISALLAAISLAPFEGIGKPERLKYELNGCWSRRIDLEHRMVYICIRETAFIIACRHHYNSNEITKYLTMLLKQQNV